MFMKNALPALQSFQGTPFASPKVFSEEGQTTFLFLRLISHDVNTTVPQVGQRSAELSFLMFIEEPPVPRKFLSGIHFTPTRNVPTLMRPFSISVPQFGQFMKVP
jgi:hypothetical protein